MLSHFLNDKDFLKKYQREQFKERLKKRKRLLQQAKAEKEAEENKRKLMGDALGAAGGATGGAGGATGGAAGGVGGGDAAAGGQGMDFNYLPHFGGIPFPPVAVGGVNYHAPMHVTINTLPYPNPRAYEDPYSHANRHLALQRKLIRKVL